ncbi:transglutaminase-like domain-containing protein [Streptomyces spongiae]|uniref:Transglutaminase domain-containing protein n=1 Tax=Streptomyces spongiae TaxID=565072 RepID=A0A5N8XGN2_9ACTN|nr:transglutaminase-like domain-containing protein [Streptomyces spongiae]MPY58128.1 transglutaminase domain-containing protein [Streptomyces spongiae]
MDFHLGYLRQTPFSDPGPLDGLPGGDIAQLAVLTRNLIIHRGEGERFGYTVPQDRLHQDAESRYVSELLRIVRERADRPLTERREPGERFVGTCRDFALLLCSLLRATGTPARIRCGFAAYFIEGWHDDHWVTEYRLPDGSWRLVDPQLGDGSYDVPFDPLDVPRDRFLVAGDAWRMCRDGRADPGTFGVSWIESLRGLWYIRGNLLRDLAALNGVEVLPWDEWGVDAPPESDAVLTEEDLALADAVAAAVAAGCEAELRRLYDDPRLRAPDEVRSYTLDGVRTVQLAGGSNVPSGPRSRLRSSRRRS